MSEENKDEDIVNIITEIKNLINFNSISKIQVASTEKVNEENKQKLSHDTEGCKTTTGVAKTLVNIMKSFVELKVNKTRNDAEKNTLEILKRLVRGASSVVEELKTESDRINAAIDSLQRGFYERALEIRSLSAFVFVIAQELAKASVSDQVTEYVKFHFNNDGPPFDEVLVLQRVVHTVASVKEDPLILLRKFHEFNNKNFKLKFDDDFYSKLSKFLKSISNDKGREEEKDFVASYRFIGPSSLEKKLQTEVIEILQTDTKQDSAKKAFLSALESAGDVYEMVRTFKTATEEKNEERKSTEIRNGRVTLQKSYLKVVKPIVLLAGTVYDDGQVIKLGDQVDDFIEKFLKEYLASADGDSDGNFHMSALEDYANRIRTIKDNYVKKVNTIAFIQMMKDLDVIMRVRRSFEQTYEELKNIRSKQPDNETINAKFMEANKLYMDVARSWSILSAILRKKLGIKESKNSPSINDKEVKERIKEVDEFRRSLEEGRTPTFFQRLLGGKAKEVAGEAAEPKPGFWTKKKKVFIFTVFCIVVLAVVGLVVYDKIRFNQLLVWPPGSSPSTPPPKADPGQPTFSISKNTISLLNNKQFTPVPLANPDGTFLFGSGGFYMSTNDTVLSNCFTTAVPSFSEVSVQVANYSGAYDIELSEFALYGFCVLSVNETVLFSFPQDPNKLVKAINSIKPGTTVGNPIVFEDSGGNAITGVEAISGATFYINVALGNFDANKTINTITFKLGFVGSGQIYFKLSAKKKT